MLGRVSLHYAPTLSRYETEAVSGRCAWCKVGGTMGGEGGVGAERASRSLPGAVSELRQALTHHLHRRSRVGEERAGTTPSSPPPSAMTAPRHSRTPGLGARGHGGQGARPRALARRPAVAPAALPAPTARPWGGRPRPNRLPGSGAYRRKEPELRRGRPAAAWAPQLRGGARSPGLRLSRSRAAGKTISLSYPLQNPP